MDRNSAAGSPGKGPTAALALGGAAEGPQWASRVAARLDGLVETMGSWMVDDWIQHPPEGSQRSMPKKLGSRSEDMEDTTHRITSTKTILKTHVL